MGLKPDLEVVRPCVNSPLSLVNRTFQKETYLYSQTPQLPQGLVNRVSKDFLLRLNIGN